MKHDFLKDNPEIVRALGDFMDRKVEQIPIVEHTFSPAFVRRMERLSRQVSKPYFHLVNTNAKKAALALAAAFIIMLTMVFSVSALREPVVRFIIEVYEKFSAVFVDHGEEEITLAALEIIYEPSWLPEGYEVNDEAVMETDLIRISNYFKGNEVLTLQQRIPSAGVNLDTEGSEIYSVAVHGQDALLYQNKGILNLVWEANQYVFSLSGQIDADDLRRVAESLREK